MGVSVPDGGDLEVGTKVKITDSFSAYGKWENVFQDSDDTSEPNTSSCRTWQHPLVACGSTENAKAPYKLNLSAPYDVEIATKQAVGSGAGVRQFTAKMLTSVPLMVLW